MCVCTAKKSRGEGSASSHKASGTTCVGVGVGMGMGVGGRVGGWLISGNTAVSPRSSTCMHVIPSYTCIYVLAVVSISIRIHIEIDTCTTQVLLLVYENALVVVSMSSISGGTVASCRNNWQYTHRHRYM